MPSTKKSNADKLYGIKESSVPQKLMMQILSWGAVTAVAWFILGGGIDTVSSWFNQTWSTTNPTRAALILLCSGIYALRLAFTQFYLIKRSMPWGEAATISIWLWVIHSTFAFFGGQNPDPVSWITWLGIGIYLVGSYLNTGSELMRHIWKKEPSHKGKLYTEGLFAYSMHINYFGDFTLFTGFSLVAGVVWTVAIPLIMASMFVFLNIPMLDEYLAKRYAGQFEGYAASTKKFIPFIY